MVLRYCQCIDQESSGTSTLSTRHKYSACYVGRARVSQGHIHDAAVMLQRVPLLQ
jgi:hypothetical protein